MVIDKTRNQLVSAMVHNIYLHPLHQVAPWCDEDRQMVIAIKRNEAKYTLSGKENPGAIEKWFPFNEEEYEYRRNNQ
ncbi:hypothetical protein KLEA5_gp26 [Aeromonas phage vB_AveS_KLEA5]|nr:hypothetical protein KLEA5_gp26 [Aeromonas phage vB_AveS_KLEA5]